MPRIELRDFIQDMTPEQKILTSDFYRRFDYATPGANRHINNVEPIFYIGLIAGSEFLTYAATKLYLCFELNASIDSAAAAGRNSMTFYDEANALHFRLFNAISFWNVGTAAINYLSNNLFLKNFYFSRNGVGNYTEMKFIGYRITLN